MLLICRKPQKWELVKPGKSLLLVWSEVDVLGQPKVEVKRPSNKIFYLCFSFKGSVQ